MKALVTCIMFLAVSAFSCLAAMAQAVEATRSLAHPKTHLTILGGELDLPADGAWKVIQPEPSSPLHNVYLVPPVDKLTGKEGTRREAIQRLKADQLKTEAWYGPIWKFAQNNNGIGPESFDDLIQAKEMVTGPDWPEDRMADIREPFFFLVPRASIRGRATEPVIPEEARPLVIELRPYLADGKH